MRLESLLRVAAGMGVVDHVALRQLAVTNALLSKKSKVEARREHLLGLMNKMVTDRRALDAKIGHIDELLRARGHEAPADSPAAEPSLSPVTSPPVLPPRPASVPSPPAAEPLVPLPPRPPAPENLIRDRLVAIVRERYTATDFGVQDFLEIMNSLAPDAAFRFETAWRLCNDLTIKKVLKVSSQKMTEKGLVRRFKPA